MVSAEFRFWVYPMASGACVDVFAYCVDAALDDND